VFSAVKFLELFQGFGWYFCVSPIVPIRHIKIRPKFLLSRASLNVYRNFGLGRGYHLGGDPVGGLGSSLGGCFRSRLLSWLGGWLGSGLGGSFGDNLRSSFGSKLGSGFGGRLGGSPLSNLGSWFGG
jgi:hypothetical protein